MNYETQRAAHTETKTQLVAATGPVSSLEREKLRPAQRSEVRREPRRSVLQQLMAAFEDVYFWKATT